MNPEVILAVQIISLVQIALALIGSIYLLAKRIIDRSLMIMPMFLEISLFLFLLERVIVKTFGVELLPVGFVNLTAIFIQLLMASTSLVTIGVLVFYFRMNGNSEKK